MVRNLYQSLLNHLSKKEFTILTGARQTGKSTLMRELERHCKTSGVPSVFLNLENKALLSELDATPLNLLPYLPVTEQRIVVFVDEIQYLNNPSNFLKLLFDEYSDRLKIVATGSSAFYLDRSFTDSLAGRKRIFHLPTCNFEEHLQLRAKDELLDEILRIRANEGAKTLSINLLQQEYEQFLLYGGYPAVITEPDLKEKQAMLAEIRDSFVKKDILESGVRNEKEFYNLFRLLASQSANLLNVSEISNTLGIKHETISRYLNILQKCFHIVQVSPFYRNLRKELTKMPKVYLLDTGLMNSLLNNFQPLSERLNNGDIWETACYKALYTGYGEEEVFYWRTADGNEVDFVLPNIEKPFAVEIKYSQTAFKASKYRMFSETYSDIPLSCNYFQPFTEDFFRRNLSV
ncbi:MAG: ATP-binding protein [Tannerella sp.]|jgi:predicted AAA+ superfamily ATPase|nr:ATP-binding protein [Tannerella sp.]